MKPGKNFSVEREIPAYYRYLVQLRVQAGRKKTEAKKSLNRPQQYQKVEGEPRPVAQFRELVNELLDNYFYKFGRREDVERPDCIKDREVPPNTSELEWDELVQIYYKVSQLQEKLGHTSIASREWEDEEI